MSRYQMHALYKKTPALKRMLGCRACFTVSARSQPYKAVLMTLSLMYMSYEKVSLPYRHPELCT